MKLRDVGLCLFGGAVLYVSMAACAGRPSGNGTTAIRPGGGGGGSGTHLAQGGGGATGSGGATGGGGAAPDAGLADALTDPVGSAHADPIPGSRLKPKYRLGEDGSKEWLAGQWYDSQRGEDCTFSLAADGKTRCLPKGNTFQYYADASCSQPMVLLQGACSAPPYGVSSTAPACALDPSGSRVYAVGQATNPPMIYGKSGSCFAIGPSSPDYQYFLVGAEIASSSFVAAVIGHD